MIKRRQTENTLILLVAAFLTAFGNLTFFSNILKTYPARADNAVYLASLVLVFGGVTVLLFAAFCFKRSTKPVLIIFLLLSSLAAYFMDSYGVIISDDMLRNAVHTNTAEALELLNLKLAAYVLLLGIVPAVAVAMTPLQWRGLRKELISRFKLIGITFTLVIGTMLMCGSFYASFLRESRELRQHANPTYYFYSAVKYLASLQKSSVRAAMVAVGTDAMIPASDIDRELVILVVGETARADRFSLNGYERETNPLLKQKNVVSFTDFWACGTSTAVSVPCMFLLGGQPGSAAAEITARENLLDVLQRSNVNILWLDNNSDSKGVAARVPFIDYKTPKNNPICDIECRDEGMLTSLQEYIDTHPKGDILIVLHQMGNHGPAYFRRYPPEFEKFKPACKSNDLSRCSREEIGNAYDNAILYTDYFLSKAIDLLQRNDSQFETSLIYVSDHGESLGENGIYLHGLPKAIAPAAQLHVPAVMWFGSNFHDANINTLRTKTSQRFSHNNVFHTLLGIFEVETSTYQPKLDMLDGTRPQKK